MLSGTAARAGRRVLLNICSYCTLVCQENFISLFSTWMFFKKKKKKSLQSTGPLSTPAPDRSIQLQPNLFFSPHPSINALSSHSDSFWSFLHSHDTHRLLSRSLEAFQVVFHFSLSRGGSQSDVLEVARDAVSLKCRQPSRPCCFPSLLSEPSINFQKTINHIVCSMCVCTQV